MRFDSYVGSTIGVGLDKLSGDRRFETSWRACDVNQMTWWGVLCIPRDAYNHTPCEDLILRTFWGLKCGILSIPRSV